MSSNRNRVNRIDRILAQYGDTETIDPLIDLLADAMHWCYFAGENFDRLARMAERHFKFELTPSNHGENT